MNTNYTYNNGYAVDAYGNRIDQGMMNMNNMNTYPVNTNVNVPVYNTHAVNSNYNSSLGAGYATGSQKVVIKQDADGYVSKEKASLHNPMTGISEKVKSKSKGKRDSSNSSEKRRSNNVNYVNTVPTGSNYGYNANQNYPVNNGYANQAYINTPSVPLQAPIISQPLGLHNQTELYAREKGKVVQTENKLKTVEKMTYVDPITGMEENAKTTVKVRGDRSRSRSQGKSKTTYDHRVEDTVNGPKKVIKEKHREGGIIDNLKNKFHNMTHKN